MFKKIWPDIKIAIISLISILVILFVLFSIDAIWAIGVYKAKHFVKVFENELIRPITFKETIVRPEEEVPINTDPRVISIAEKLSLNFHGTTTTTKPRINIPIPSEALTENIIWIPKFNIKAPITKVETENKKTIYAALKKGVIVYPTTDLPGNGYTIILGHSSRYPWEPGRYKAVFSLLNELETNDIFYIYYNQRPMAFQVQDKKIFLPYPKGEYTTETIFPPTVGEKTLILQSCWPVGVDYKRIAIKAFQIQ